MQLETRPLGDSGLRVPVIAFGAWALGGWGWGGSDDARSREALRAGIDAGITAIDTAPVYGFGRSERVVGEAIAGQRERVVLMTKAGLRWDDPGGTFFFETAGEDGRPLRIHRNSRPASLRLEVERSLQRLGVETIDLLQIHWPDPGTPVAESMGALLELRSEGKLRAIGVSNFTPALLEEARRALGAVPLASTQERYSLVARGIEPGALRWAWEQQVGVLAYSPLEQGLLSGKFAAGTTFPPGDGRAKRASFAPQALAAVQAALERAVRPVAQRHDATLAQVALAWVLAQPGITCALVGARSAAQARENARVPRLERTEVAAIGAAFANLDFSERSGAPPAGILRRLLWRLTGGTRGACL